MIAFSQNLSARDCSQEFDFKLFINGVFTKFADAFVKEMMHLHNENFGLFLKFFIIENFQMV